MSDIVQRRTRQCPRCGDTNGYEYRTIERWVRYGSWGEESEGSFENVLRDPKTVRCVACRYRVSQEIAKGARNDSALAEKGNDDE